MKLLATATFWLVLDLSVRGSKNPTSRHVILSDEAVDVSSAVAIDVAAVRAISLPKLGTGEVSAGQRFYEVVVVTQ